VLQLRVNIAFLTLLAPYLVIRRLLRLIVGTPKNYQILIQAGLASSLDFLEKLRVPEAPRVWMDVRTRLGFEKDAVDAMLQVRGNLFLDVGANVGYYSALLRRNFKSILAFEPHPETLRLLMETIAVGKLRNVTALNQAVSDRDGFATLHIHSIGGRHSIAHPEGKEGLIVRTTTIDSLATGSVDLVKVDVEGAEWQVVKGAERSVREGRILRWIIEVHNKEVKSDFENYFRQRKYETRWLGDRHLFASLA